MEKKRLAHKKISGVMSKAMDTLILRFAIDHVYYIHATPRSKITL